MKCKECEDSGYMWDTAIPCPKCDIGAEKKYEENKSELRHLNIRAKALRNSIKAYELSKSKIDYGIFNGDGRTTVSPINYPVGTRPISVTKSAARACINRFLSTKSSTHSVFGSTLWVILYFCVLHDIKYTLFRTSGIGYYVQLNAFTGDDLSVFVNSKSS